MTVEKFISTVKLEEYIMGEVRTCLHANDIFPLNRYGYLDENTPDPNFLGHSEHPLGWDFAFANSSMGKPLTSPLEPWREFLAVCYEDFQGLMASARLAIGLTLFHGELLKENIFADSALFELHRIGSIINLDMAADRLRDFFIAAVFSKKTKEYEHGKYDGNSRKRYVTPFVEAAHASGGLQDALSELVRKLDTNAGTLFDYRKQRNEIVHEIATQMGRMESKRLSDISPSSSRKERVLNQQERERIFAGHKELVVSELQMPMQWYRLLVRTSSNAFEYTLRTLGRP
jgi:hypothetical protein